MGSHNGFLREDHFSYESSIASNEFMEKYHIIGHLGKVKFNITIKKT